MNEINASMASGENSPYRGSRHFKDSVLAHMNAMERVQSIVWGLAAHMRHLANEAEEKGSHREFVESGEVEAFVDNVEWLIDTVFEDSYDMRSALRKDHEAEFEGKKSSPPGPAGGGVT